MKPATLPSEGWTPVLQLTREQLLRGLALAGRSDRDSVAALSSAELQRLAPSAKHLADPLVWPRALVCALAHVLGVPAPTLPDPVADSRLERILNTIDEGAVWGWDDDGDFFSPSVHRLAGAPPDTDALALWTDIIHPDDYEAFASAAPDEPAEVEYRVLGLDGVTRCVLDRTWVQHLPDGGIFVKGMAYDITRRRGAEEALRQAHADLAAMHAALREAHDQVARLVETIDEVLWTATFAPGDFAAAQLYVSPSLERLLGCSVPDDPVRAQEVWRAAVHPDDIPVADAALEDTLKAKDGTAEYRVRGHRRGRALGARQAAGQPPRGWSAPGVWVAHGRHRAAAHGGGAPAQQRHRPGAAAVRLERDGDEPAEPAPARRSRRGDPRPERAAVRIA